ncbi:L-rhamnose 1-dehydrogenase (NADP(+)) [uncultured archaeon]|nr:L-rhamnose 1-dehydrogenase (NADP(+)) [uncultured archaeon]
MDFKDQVVIVTGAGRGIGEEIAVQFAKEGAKVVVASLHGQECDSTVKKIASAKGKAIAVPCDVSSARDVKSLFEKTLREFGRVDVLVNNAGIFPFVPFKDMVEEQWDRVIGVNLKSVFLCSKEAASVMVKQGRGGKIVNISSIASIVGYPMLTHYCASKGGINGFTRALALELAPSKIRVNAVLPGGVKTPGVGELDEKTLKGIESSVPLARMGEPIDIANAVLFLASDKSDYITGQTLVVDGGSTAKD